MNTEAQQGKKFYEESAGNTSATRITLILGMIMAFVLALMVLYVKWDAGIFLPVTFLGVPMTGKAAEKFKR
jgi:hypothetical protein